MVRVPEWPKKLSNYLSSMQSAKFEWGKTDCISFAVGAVSEITGVDARKEYSYSTREGAYAIIEEAGGITSLVAKHFGSGHRNIMQAKRGDLVSIKNPEIIIGVVDDSGQKAAFISESQGLVRVPLEKVWRIWPI